MRYAIWYHLYNSKNVKNTHGGVLLLVKLQAQKLCVIHICDALRNLVLFVQFKKREKNPWRSATFSKVAGC